MQVSVYHQPVETPDEEMCQDFFAAVLYHQQDMVKQMKDGESDVSRTFRQLSDKHSETIENLN